MTTGDARRSPPVLRYVTHPQVEIVPQQPVARWRLSLEGARRAEAMCRQPWVRRIARILSSDETKAMETAEVLGAHIGVDVEVRSGIGENDRSATGFVPPARFEQLADRFFARPEESVQGWERAVDAQSRIAAGLRDLLSDAGSGDVAVVGHGGVGTLWYCSLAGLAIDRRHDQPGQGHYFTVDLGSGLPTHGWRPIDEVQTG